MAQKKIREIATLPDLKINSELGIPLPFKCLRE
jgi:hypothetical protein